MKFVKWSDPSYFSLHETVNKIHGELFRLVYEYRDANNINVSVVLYKLVNDELVCANDAASASAENAVDVCALCAMECVRDVQKMDQVQWLIERESVLLSEDRELSSLAWL